MRAEPAIDAPGLKQQAAALPFHSDATGLKVLLVTSLRTQRWIPPKGWPEKDVSPADAAGREALEEAGVIGEVADMPIGAFDYFKHRNGVASLCRVHVFPMRVTQLLPQWPEQSRRTRRWFTVEQACQVVDDPGFARLLLRLGGLAPVTVADDDDEAAIETLAVACG